MANKQKIKELLDRLNAIDTNSFPDATSLSEDLIKKEIADATSKVKDSATIKYLDVLNEKLDKFKIDFDLKPISESIDEFQSDLQSLKDEMSGEFGKNSAITESKIKNLTEDITVLESLTDSKVEASFTLLDSKIVSNITDLKSLREQLIAENLVTKNKDSSLSVLISDIQNSTQELLDDSKKSSNNIKKIKTDFEDKINKLRVEIFSKLASHGGGSMNRQISVNSSVMSTKYTDVNFIAGSNLTLTKTNNNTTKQVDITITASGGGTGFTLLPATGSINSSNVTFTFTQQPAYIISDGAWYRVNKGWTWSVSTATMTIPPNDDIYGFV